MYQGISDFLRSIGNLRDTSIVAASLTVIIAMLKWLGDVKKSRIAQKEMAKHSMQLEQYKLILETVKSAFSGHSTMQINEYMNVWRTLHGLKIAADNLWDHVNAENLEAFMFAYEDVTNQAGAGIILMERSHAEELNCIIQDFNQYKIRKEELGRLYGEESDADLKRIRQLIAENAEIKERYTQIYDKIHDSFRQRINGDYMDEFISRFTVLSSDSAVSQEVSSFEDILRSMIVD